MGQVKSCGATQFDENIHSALHKNASRTVTGAPRRLLLTPCAFGRPHRSIRQIFHYRIPTKSGSLQASDKVTLPNRRFSLFCIIAFYPRFVKSFLGGMDFEARKTEFGCKSPTARRRAFLLWFEFSRVRGSGPYCRSTYRRPARGGW